MIYSYDNVISAVKKTFPSFDFYEIIEKFEEIPNYGNENQNRIYLAILKISEGNYSRLLEFIDIAKRDYRDVLYLAEYNNEKLIDEPYQNLF